jgi:hypothetical protein
LEDAIDLIQALNGRYSEYEGDVAADLVKYRAAIAAAKGHDHAE